MFRLRTAAARKTLVRLSLALTLACALAGSALADTTHSGQTSGGAYYQIIVPDPWNGSLVLWNHGYSLTPGVPDPDLGPLRDVQLAQGFAVAASSYSDVGWALFDTDKDLEDLYKVFKKEFGAPDEVILNGASLGGIVTAQALEESKLGNVVGAFPFCGALGGSRLWDGALDLRLTYDAVCSAVPGAELPGGAMGRLDGSTRTLTDNIISVDACFGILFPPGRTPDQQARLDQFLASTQIPENFIITDIAFYGTFGMRDLWDKLGGKLGMGNANVVYPDPVIDATIERVTPNNGARNKLRKHYTPDGEVGDVKIVSLHTDKDGLVIVENENEYAQVVPPSQLTVGIVVEAVPTHCGFTAAELVAGWESLRGWVGGAPQPTAASMQGLCQFVESPIFPGPCRIDPAFVVPDMDGRVLPRNDEDSDSDSDSD